MPVLVALTVVAGCVGGVGSPADEAAAFSVDNGFVTGVVFSDELFPVAGAVVSIVDGPIATTNDVGEFELGGVLAGDQTLNVTREGYEPLLREIEVRPGEVLELRLELKGIPGQSPYVLTIPYEGFSVCAFSIVYSAGPTDPVPCPFGTRKGTMKVEVGADWRAGVHEMTWKTTEEMIFASSVATSERPGLASCQTSGTTHSWCPAMIWGRNPQRIFARPLDPVYAKKYAIDGKEMWPEGGHTSFIFTSYSGYLRTEVNATAYPACVQINRQFNVPEHWGCPFGIGYAIGIRFQFYHTTFYLEAPLKLEEFSALPDG